jgi:hypothetical protein
MKMTQEEQHIKQKIENLSDLDFYVDDADLWNRLEGRLDEKKPQKPKFLWAAAASLIIGMFFFVRFEENTPPKITILPKENIKTQTEQATKFTPKKDSKIIVKQKTLNNESVDSQVFVEEIGQAKRLAFELDELSFKDNFDSLSFNKKAISVQPKFKLQQVTVVDFPIIPDEMMKREVFAKRLFRQVKSFNTEGKIDWRELNIEPRNVWAYLERNFKYDTTSIQNKKTQ